MFKMKTLLYSLAGVLLLFIPLASGADTRSECVASYGFGNDNFGFGGDSFGGEGFGGDGFGFGGMEPDEFEGGFGFGGMEPDEFGGGFGEAGEGFGGMGGFGGGASVTGKLFCPKGNRGSILVKRIRFGVSTFPGTCQSVPFCKEVFENGEQLAKKCNGGSTCSINSLQPKFLSCGRPSTYMLVEYECVDTWATFEICESVNTVARGASVIITSPGYLGTSSTGMSGVQMCECIMRSKDGADMYMDYLQTQLSSQGDQCPYDFVLVESKKNINQTGIDKEIEVCGKQHVGGRWLQGAVRISYASGGPMKKQGLLARFTADNIGNKPMIELECGKVDTKGLKLLQRPPAPETRKNEGVMPFRPGFGMPMMPMMPPQFPTPTASGPKPTWNIKIASDPPVTRNKEPTLKVNLPMNTFAQSPSFVNPAEKATQHVAENKPPVKNQPKKNENNRNRGRPQGGAGRRPPKKNNAGKVVADGESSVEKTNAENQTSGGMVALVFAGIGAVLILGSVGILFLHNYRKRQRIKREEEVYASGGSASETYGKGWEVASDGESIYATVADVDAHREGCVNPAVGTHDECERMDSQAKMKVIRSSNVATTEDDNEDIADSYDKIVLKTQTKVPGNSCEIAVIDVHQSFDADDNKPKNLHSENCLLSSNYAISEKATNRCDECNIVRPPRRKDTEREYSTGYDNNVGVTRHIK